MLPYTLTFTPFCQSQPSPAHSHSSIHRYLLPCTKLVQFSSVQWAFGCRYVRTDLISRAFKQTKYIAINTISRTEFDIAFELNLKLVRRFFLSLNTIFIFVVFDFCASNFPTPDAPDTGFANKMNDCHVCWSCAVRINGIIHGCQANCWYRRIATG